MDASLPADIWVFIAKLLVRSSGRNDVLRLRCVSKTARDSLQDSASLWQDMIFQTHFRLYEKADPVLIHGMTAAHWRKLLRSFSALGLRSEPTRVNLRDPQRTKVLRWLPEWGEEAGEDESKPEDPQEESDEAEDDSEESTHDEDDDGYYNNEIGDELTVNGQLIYGLSTVVNTTSFWFSHRKSEDGTPLDIKIGNLVNNDPMRDLESTGCDGGSVTTLINNEELIQSLFSIFPRFGNNEVELTAMHFAITPEYIGPDEDVYITDPVYRWDEKSTHPKRNIGCYRYTMPLNPIPFGEFGANRIYHILLPLQDPERVGFNEDRVMHYQEQMKQGSMPTVLTLSRVFNKYRLYKFDQPSPDHRTQFVYVHVIVDGHHKLEAARRLNLPVGILTVCPYRFDRALKAIHNHVPSWPFSSLELSRLCDPSGPFKLNYDNFFNLYGRSTSVEEQKKQLLELLSLAVPNAAHDPSFEEKVSVTAHGGSIEFETYDLMIRVLRECSGQIQGGLGPISFQIERPAKQEEDEGDEYHHDNQNLDE